MNSRYGESWSRRGSPGRIIAGTAVALLVLSACSFQSNTPSSAESRRIHIGEPTAEVDLFDAEIMPRVKEAQPLVDELEANPPQGEGLGADDEAIYGYPRVEFEEKASALLDRLLESQPDSFGGASMDPIDPFIHLGYVGDPSALEAEASSVGIEVRMIPVQSTLAERKRIGERLTERGIDASVADFGNYVVLEKGADQINKAGEEFLDAIQYAVDLPEEQRSELEKAVAAAPETGVAIGDLLLVPVEPVHSLYSLSAGVTLKKSNGQAACTSGFAMRRIATGVGYISTAAHCDSPLNRNGVVLGQQASGNEYSVNQDWKILNVPSSVGPAIGKVWVSASNQIGIKGPHRSSWPGTKRCARGITSGYQCGYTATAVCGGWPAATYKMTYGDSGGPVLYPYGTVLAAGLVRGACGGRDTYTSIYRLELAGGSSPRYTVITG